jgi:hypothetical protein
MAAGLGVAEPSLGQTRWSATTYGVAQPFSFLGFFFKKKHKIYDEGILGIKKPNGLNYHNLKVWGGKVSHFKLWR